MNEHRHWGPYRKTYCQDIMARQIHLHIRLNNVVFYTLVLRFHVRVIYTVSAVSYTHLDVYKRQEYSYAYTFFVWGCMWKRERETWHSTSINENYLKILSVQSKCKLLRALSGDKLSCYIFKTPVFLLA